MPTKNKDTGSPGVVLVEDKSLSDSTLTRLQTRTFLGLVAFYSNKVGNHAHLLQNEDCSRANDSLITCLSAMWHLCLSSSWSGIKT